MEPATSPASAPRPLWSAVLRALRNARGVSQDGWAALLGYSVPTIRRWERGGAVPTADAEAAIVALCQEAALFRSYTRGPLAGLTLTPQWLAGLLADARMGRVARTPAGTDAAPSTASRSPAVSRSRASLPVPPSSLIGRERELTAAVLLLTGGTHLLTLTGPGGCGKTRLALAIAAQVAGTIADSSGDRDGVAFVDLSAVTDPSLVAAAIAQALELGEHDGRSLATALAGAEQYQRLLLVLDNFEQVVEAAPLLRDLVATVPGLTILVTSRVLLRVSGEREYVVPPLPLPDLEQVSDPTALAAVPSVALFVQRAQAAHSGFALTEANAAAVAAVCTRLDGLPLALELAAARSRILSPPELLVRLDQRLPLLSGGGRDLPARQQTVRRTLDWSYQLLVERERVLLRRLSVFAGGWTVEAAEVVCAAGALSSMAILDGLTTLVEHSLVVVQRSEDATRYRLLETVREYAQERLEEAGETATLRDRHATFFLALAEAGVVHWAGPEEHAWFARLEGDYDNFQLALAAGGTGQARLCAALRRFWAVRGLTRQGRIWLEVTLTASTPMPAGLRAALLRSAGTMDFLEANLDQARARLAEAVALARQLGDRAGVAAALNTLGLVAYRMGEYAAAEAMHEEELALFQALERPAGIAAALQNLGNVSLQQDDVTSASERFNAALAIRRRLGIQLGIPGALNNLGNVAFRKGDYRGARAQYEQAAAAGRAMGSQAAYGVLLHNLGGVALRQGEYDAARALYEQALAIRRAMGRRWGISATLANLAVLAYAEGDPAGAQALLSESVTYASEPAATGEVVSVLGRLTEEGAPAMVGVQTLPVQQAISEALADEDPWWPDATDT